MIKNLATEDTYLLKALIILDFGKVICTMVKVRLIMQTEACVMTVSLRMINSRVSENGIIADIVDTT